MPCHARAAAPPTQTLSYLWISDDLLTDAFNRFARVSHATRRYGSNVPGPLEARRRLARRRMGMVTANAVASAPSLGFDLSTFFGLRSSKPLDQSWKWEAPNLCQSIQYGPPPAPPPLSPWSWALSEKNDVREKRDPVEDVDTVDPVSASKQALQDLVDALPATKSIGVSEIQPLTDFLQSSQDEPQAHNVVWLSRWLRSRVVTKQAMQLLDRVICDKLKMEAIELDEASGYIGHILRHDGLGTVHRICAILDSTPNDSLESIAYSVTQSCLAGISTSDPSPGMRRLASWLDALWDCYVLQGRHHENVIWTAVYSILATRLHPSDLSSHFHRLNAADLTRVLLTVWAPILGQVGKQDIVTHQSFRSWKQIPSAERTVDVAAILADLDVAQAQDPARSSHSPFVDLLVIMSRHSVPYDYLFTSMFDILCAQPSISGQHATSRRVFQFIMEICRHSELGIPEAHAPRLINYFLDGRDGIISLRMAWHIFRQVPTISLRQFQELPLRMAKAGAGPLEVFQLLQRRENGGNVAPEFRSKPQMTLTQERIDLVHLLAHTWAHNPLSSSRVAFRRVWACYRYLRDRGAPLTDTMSRAMVHAGALRNLLEGRRIPTEQFRYILNLVRRLEGAEIADELDRSMWTIWAQQVRPQSYMQKVQRIRRVLAGDAIDDSQKTGALKWKKEPWSRLSFKTSASQSRPWYMYQLPMLSEQVGHVENRVQSEHEYVSCLDSGEVEGVKDGVVCVDNVDETTCRDLTKTTMAESGVEMNTGMSSDDLKRPDLETRITDQAEEQHTAQEPSSHSQQAESDRDALLHDRPSHPATHNDLDTSRHQPKRLRDQLGAYTHDQLDELFFSDSVASALGDQESTEKCGIDVRQWSMRSRIRQSATQPSSALSPDLHAIETAHDSGTHASTKEIDHVTRPIVESGRTTRNGLATQGHVSLNSTTESNPLSRTHLAANASSIMSAKSRRTTARLGKSIRPRPAFYTHRLSLSDDVAGNATSAKVDQSH